MPDRFAEIRHGPQAKAVAIAKPRAAHPAPLAVPMILVGIVLAGAVLSACSSTSDTSYSLFVDPGKYQYYNCAQIAGEMKNWSNRQKELQTLMDRAEQSAGGAAVGLIAYKAEFVAAQEELESLHSAARSKKCEQDGTWHSSTVIR
jgi:hypothetical protein